jgi:hypothetical protein
VGLEKRDPAGGPQPTSDEKSGLQPHIRCACHAPQVFFKSQAPKRGRVLQDRFQQGATLLGFSTFNSTYVLTKSQVGWRDSVRSIGHLHAAPSVKYQFIHEYRHLFPIIRMCRVLGISEYAPIIGVKGERVRESGVMNSLRIILKMPITPIGVSTEVLVFMQN